jgi:hypothetical protein
MPGGTVPGGIAPRATALKRTQDLKRAPELVAMERDVLDRIRATSGLQSDLTALRRLTGHVQFERPDKAHS